VTLAFTVSEKRYCKNSLLTKALDVEIKSMSAQDVFLAQNVTTIYLSIRIL